MKYFIIAILGICSELLLASTDIFAMLDRHQYVAGEAVNGMIAINSNDADSTVLLCHVTTDQSDSIVMQFYVKLNNGKAIFYVPLLNSLKSQTYHLNFYGCYTKDDINSSSFPLAYSSEKFDIIKITSLSFILLDVSKNEHQASFFRNITSSTKKVREKERLFDFNIDSTTRTINLPMNTGIDIEFLCLLDKEYQRENINYNYSIHETSANYFKNLKSNIFIVLSLKSENTVKILGLLGVYDNELYKTYFTKTDNNGIICLDVLDFTSSKIFQLLTHPDDKTELTASMDLFERFKTDRAELDSKSNREYIDDANKRQIIHENFGINLFQYLSDAKKQMIKKPEAEKNYIVSNYKRFPKFKTFCVENSLALSFKENGEILTPIFSPPASIAKEFNSKWENPAFIVNGIFTKNYKDIANLDLEQIDKIMLYYNPKSIRTYLGIFGSRGIVDITTKVPVNIFTSYDESRILKIEGFQSSILSPQSILDLYDSRIIPVLIPTSHWSMNYNISQSSSINKIKFSSDKSPKIILVLSKDNVGYYITTKEITD